MSCLVPVHANIPGRPGTGLLPAVCGGSSRPTVLQEGREAAVRKGEREKWNKTEDQGL